MIKRNWFSALALFTLLLVGSTLGTHAAIETNLTALVTDMSAYWDTIKVVVLGVFVFGIALHYAKKLKR